MQNLKSSRFRFVIIGLLFFIIVANYIDRSAISYAMDPMSHLFNWNDTQIGLILGAFGIGYLVTTFLGGIAADRYGARLTLLFAVILWSVAMLFTGFAMGFWMVFLMRVLLGVAEGPNFPCMTRAIGDWLPKEARVRALSYSLMAVPIALAIGGPLVSQLILHFSWRGMFFILGLLALLWLPLWWHFFRDYPDQSPRVNASELAIILDGKNKVVHVDRKRMAGLWRYLLSNTTLLANYWAFFVFGYYLFFFMGWLPTYLDQQYHLKLASIGLFTLLPWTFAALLMWGFGQVSDAIFKKTSSCRKSRSYPIMLSQLLAALCIIPVALTSNIVIAMIFISLAVGFSMSTNAAYYAINIDIAKERAGTALGIMDAAFAIAGFVAPVFTGWLVTVTGHFEVPFVVLSVLAFSSVIIVYCFHHPDSTPSLSSVSSAP